MRGRDFLDKMELVSPIYVEGADRTPIIRPKQWPRFVVAAACLCLVAWGAWGLTGGFDRGPGHMAAPGESEGPEETLMEVGGPSLEPCPGTLGFDECWVVREKTRPGTHNGYFYARMDDGTIQCIATVCACSDELEVYRVDLDGDGIEELICNNTFGDGVEEVYIYRNCGIGVEVGWLALGYWDLCGFDTMGAASARAVRYDLERGFVVTGYDLEGKPKEEIVQDMGHFRFEPYEPPFDAPEIDVESDDVTSPAPDDVASIAPEPCPATLGFENCVMTWEESLGTMIWRFYAVEDGQYLFLAGTWDCRGEPDVYRVDLDGDGVEEMVCNRQFADGGQDVVVYRNRDGQIERGSLDMSYEFQKWSERGLTPIGALGSTVSWFDPDLNGHGAIVLEASCWNEKQEKVQLRETFTNLEHFIFEPYGPEVAGEDPPKFW